MIVWMTQGAPPTSDLRPAAGHDQAQRVAAILRLTPRSQALTAVACAISAITLAGDIHTGTVVMWLATALIVCAGRYAIFLAHRSNATRLSPELWENTAACGAFAMGCTWAALTMLGPLPGAKILFVALVLCFAAQSSTGVLSASLRNFAAFVIPVTLALLALLFREFGGISASGIVIAILFGVAMVTTFLEMRRTQLNVLAEARQYEDSFRQQRLIFDCVQSGIAITREKAIVDFNPRAAAMFGYEREELIGRLTRVFFFDDKTWEDLAEQAYARIRSGHTFQTEMTLRAKNGAPVICEMTMDGLSPTHPEDGLIIMFTDVTERRRLEFAVRAALAQQQAVFDNAPIGIAFTSERKLVICNERMLSMFGYQMDEIVGRDGRWLYADEKNWEVRNQEIADAFARGEQVAFQEAFVTKTGQTVWCQVRGSQVEAAAGVWGTAVFTFADIGERKRMEQSLRESREQLDLVIRASMVGTWDWNIATDETVLSHRFAQILGFPADTPASALMPLASRIHPEDREFALAQFVRHLKSEEPVRSELRLRAKDGSYRWINADGISQHGPDGRAVRSIGAISDITDLKEREAEIKRLALHDPLTGLPNRRLFEDRLEFALTGARRNRSSVAVMLIDLDGFKSINDQFGHDAGDEMLRAVSQRLRDTIRASDTVARTGGDEFVVIAEGAVTREAIRQLAEKILSTLCKPVSWQDHSLSVGSSIGIAVYPGDADHPAQLVRMADEAMYRVKDAGRNGIRFHSELAPLP